MSLPTPNLDDRKFQDLVDDVKRQIGLRCPEWTDHNVSDPGVTMIELFSWMFEIMLYRMNQVPEKNYIKFLEMLGIGLEPPTPARTDLRFLLSRPVEDEDGEEVYEVTLPATDTIAATVRTDTEDAVEFATDQELRMVRPKLAALIAAPFIEGQGDAATLTDARDFPNDGVPFAVYSPSPRRGDALYFGFEPDISSNTIQFDLECVEGAGTGLDRRFPLQVWEYWNGQEGSWDILPERPDDKSGGFGQNGTIDIAIPPALVARQVGGKRAYWIRARYEPVMDSLPTPPANYVHTPYLKPPQIKRISVRTIGGTAPASNCATMRMEALGQSDGKPGQVFKTQRSPILPRKPGETIYVGPLGAELSELTEYKEVDDFSASEREDRHFMCDSFTGEVYFGPNVLQPDGSARQHGAIPEQNQTIYFSRYRYGGGVHGNIRENRVTVLKSSIPYIADVKNAARADGGRDQEGLEHAKMRGRSYLRIRERAVTAEDYEVLARRACSGVGRATCVQGGRIHSAGEGGANIPPGVVRVLIVPALGESVMAPRPADLRVPQRTIDEVHDYLDERRLLTTVLMVGEPDYVYVSTDITFAAKREADENEVARRVREALELYLHPLLGGPRLPGQRTGFGWPFCRTLTLTDIYAQIGEVPGVAFLLGAKIFVSRMVNDRLEDEKRVRPRVGVPLGPTELLATREHRIKAVPLDRVDQEMANAAEGD